MTSMAELLGQPVTLAAVKTLVAEIFARYFGYTEILWQKNLPTQYSALSTQHSANVASQ
jgi:hypothetical protein